MRRIEIFQRESAIIAPTIDINQVDGVGSRGFGSCFALGIYDKEANVGFFSHADTRIEPLFWRIHKSIGLLRNLGARNLTIETVNARKYPLLKELHDYFLVSTVSLLKFYGFHIERNGKDGFGWSNDLGTSSYAALGTFGSQELGLRAPSWEEFQKYGFERETTPFEVAAHPIKLFFTANSPLYYRPEVKRAS